MADAEAIYEECRNLPESELREIEAWVDREFDMIPSSYWEKLVRDGEVEVIGCDVEEGEDEEEYEYRCPEIPMWGYLFMPRYRFFAEWIEEHADEVARVAGFIVYRDAYGNVVLGVNGAGYDFYRHHWCPLRKLYFAHSS